MEWLTVLPPVTALCLAILTRNVYWALGFAIWLSETLIANGNPFAGGLQSVERSVAVFGNLHNTRILVFCLIIGALIAFMSRSGGIGAMVTKLYKSGISASPRRAGMVAAISGIVLFIETNISLLASGILGRPLFDRVGLSRERLAYIIDSTCAPVSVLILFNGWGAYIAGLMINNGVEDAIDVLFRTLVFNIYPVLTVIGVILTVLLNRSFGPMAAADAQPESGYIHGAEHADDVLSGPPGRAWYMAVPVLVLVCGTVAFMSWTGGWTFAQVKTVSDIVPSLIDAMMQGSGAQSILWAVILATLVAGVCLVLSGRAKGQVTTVTFKGMGDLLPAVSVIFLALVLGDSLKALGTGAFLTGMAAASPMPWLIPAILFVAAGLTSFTTGTSWGTYGILVPVAVPLAAGAGIPLPLAVAAVMGGGVFGDHCSPISDTTIIASLAAGCDHMAHVRTQLPYALGAGVCSLLFYMICGWGAGAL